MKVQPSRVARLVAGREWPEVQSQYKLGPGVFAFSCAGHGGVVAVIGAAALPGELVQLARTERKVEFAVFAPGRVYYTGGGGAVTSRSAPIYEQSTLRQWAETCPYPSYEVWLGEEDCDWATIIAANDNLRLGGIEAGYFSRGLERNAVLSCLDNWNPSWTGPVRELSVGARPHSVV